MDKERCQWLPTDWKFDLIISEFQIWVTLTKLPLEKPYYHFRYFWMKKFGRYWNFENGRDVVGTSDTAW